MLNFEGRKGIMEEFFNKCRIELRLKHPIRSLHNSHGKMISSLGDLEETEKFVYISIGRDFQPLTFIHYRSWKETVSFEKLIGLRTANKLEERFRRFKRIKLVIGRSASFVGQSADAQLFISDDEGSKKLRLNKKRQKTSGTELFIHLQDVLFDGKINKIRESKKECTIRSLEVLINKYNKMRLVEKGMLKRKPKYKGSFCSPLMMELVKQLQIVRSSSYHQIDLSFFTGKAMTASEKANLRRVENIYSKVNRFTKFFYPDLVKYKIPELEKKYPTVQRREFYELFVNFKVLIKLTILLNQSIDGLNKGINFKAFYLGLNQMNTVEKDTAELMFNNLVHSFQDRMNLKEYFEGMLILRSKNIADKIDLFINVGP